MIFIPICFDRYYRQFKRRFSLAHLEFAECSFLEHLIFEYNRKNVLAFSMTILLRTIFMKVNILTKSWTTRTLLVFALSDPILKNSQLTLFYMAVMVLVIYLFIIRSVCTFTKDICMYRCDRSTVYIRFSE